jgi:selenide, water dikinase
MTDSVDNNQLLTVNSRTSGCSAKISAAELDAILCDLPKPICKELIAGIANFEDAAVYKISEELAIVQTIDFFPPIVSDPFLFGRIAANNALSDIYAMGAKPIFALNVLSFPTCDYPLDTVKSILKGGLDQLEKAGAILAGGHSIQTSEILYGLAVTGLINPHKVLTNGGARPGDSLLITKPIGTGIALLGFKADSLSADSRNVLLEVLTSLNDGVLPHLEQFPIHAGTDVTGYGLAGHLHEMAQASGLSCKVNFSQVPLIPEVRELASEGFVPAAAYGNRNSFEKWVSFKEGIELAQEDICFDPQTAGGFLLAVEKEKAEECCAALSKTSMSARIIGSFEEGRAGYVEVYS